MSMTMWGFGRAAVGAGAIVAGAALCACAHSDAERGVLTQSSANTAALAANLRTLSNAARESARVECESVVRRARERVAADLVRLRSTILPDTPTEAELAAPDAPWAASLRGEAEALGARIARGGVDERGSIVRALADDHPATIDRAAGTQGFSDARVLRDAVDLDRLNQAIDAENNAAVRTAMLTRRDAMLAPYLPVRLSVEATGRYRESLDAHLATVEEQAQIAGLHAQALGTSAQGKGVVGGALGLLADQDIRAAVLGIVARQWGEPVAADVAARIELARKAIEHPTK